MGVQSAAMAQVSMHATMNHPAPSPTNRPGGSPSRLVPAIGALVGFLVLGATAGCGPGRKAAATQPTPAAFDPAASDAKALDAVDKMLEAMGGRAAWDTVKQLRWTHKYKNGDELKAWFRHSWDIWNGRHRFEIADMETYRESMAAGTPDKTKFSVAMYDLFDHEGKGYAMYGGREVMKGDRDRIVKNAYERWKSDAYQVSMLFKLRDPGTVLTAFGELKDIEGMCRPACTTIKVSFVDSVGKDTYYVNINTASNLPEIVEKQVSGGRIGYAVSGWQEVGALKFPTKHQNIGLKSEVFVIEDLKIGSPDDELYVPQVR